MSNQLRCAAYTSKKQNKKIDEFVNMYNGFKAHRSAIIDQIKQENYCNHQEVQSAVPVYSDCATSDKVKRNASSISAPSNEEVLQNKRKKICEIKKQSDSSEFDLKLEQWLSASKSDNEALADIQSWIVDSGIAHIQADKLLAIVQARWMPNIPKSTRTLLSCNVNLDITDMKSCGGSVGEYVYFGLEKKLKNTINIEWHSSDVLELILFIDGLSPFKSSSKTIWPVLCKVYTKEDHYKPFSVAVYAGDSKPEDPTVYMKDFICEYNELQKSKIIIDDRTFQVKIKCFICDTPARSFVRCTAGHTAFAACERCYVLGKKIEKTTVFIDTDAKIITNASFRSIEKQNHHKDVSPLMFIEPSIDIVKQFMLDPMHLLYLGVAKRLLEYLLSTSTRKVKLSAVLKSELERRTALIQKNIPQEFPRKMRHTGHYSKYKAVEYKFFAQYAAPIVLKDLVSEQVYNHFMLFTCACRLMSYQNALPHVQKAKDFFKKFVDEAPAIYGESFMSLNVHNLVHLCDDVVTTGCNFNELSAFCFESHLGSISRSLRSPTHLLAQYCQRELEKESHGTKGSTSWTETRILMQQADGKILKIQYKDIALSTTAPNNTVLLNDDCFGEISSLNKVESGFTATINKFIRKESIFYSPCESSVLNFWQVGRTSSKSIQVPLNKITQKCIKFTLNLSSTEEQKCFVVPLLHLDPSEKSSQ